MGERSEPLERLIEHINSHAGVRGATFDEIARDFLRRSPRAGRPDAGVQT